MVDKPVDWQPACRQAEALANAARSAEALALCEATLAQHADNLDAHLSFGALLLGFGFLGAAEACFRRGRQLAPQDLRCVVNLANVAREAGQHGEARRLYAALLDHLPDHPVIRRNALVSLEYDFQVTDAERFAQALAWGHWAIGRAGGLRPRPPLAPLAGRRLRVGYLSADFCQHPVGLFLKDVLAAHDRTQVEVFAYGAGRVVDWVSEAIRRAATFHDVSLLDDAAVAARIAQDQVDVLVDLSGHTGGSRLTVFAHRPAPVQVSWLGYFATTGLPVMDAVLLDDWHAPPGMEAQFSEAIVRLPGGRFCYTPVPFAPAVAEPPCLTRGAVTFGCFNNTAKLNGAVYALWARLLQAVPGSRLVLKWRTFQDDGLCAAVRRSFASLGIAAERLELRPASFHADLLKEYADIDIALDPFPFSGGLTSCEALWMGVPVVTWPQSRVVGRQTYAFLSAIGLADLAATDADGYVAIAAALASDPDRLRQLRHGLRPRMTASPLCDVVGFTRRLEAAYQQLFRLEKRGEI